MTAVRIAAGMVELWPMSSGRLGALGGGFVPSWLLA